MNKRKKARRNARRYGFLYGRPGIISHDESDPSILADDPETWKMEIRAEPRSGQKIRVPLEELAPGPTSDFPLLRVGIFLWSVWLLVVTPVLFIYQFFPLHMTSINLAYYCAGILGVSLGLRLGLWYYLAGLGGSWEAGVERLFQEPLKNRMLAIRHCNRLLRQFSSWRFSMQLFELVIVLMTFLAVALFIGRIAFLRALNGVEIATLGWSVALGIWFVHDMITLTDEKSEYRDASLQISAMLNTIDRQYLGADSKGSLTVERSPSSAKSGVESGANSDDRSESIQCASLLN